MLWIKKSKGLKKNGGLDKEYSILTKNNFHFVFEQKVFNKTNLCYLTLTLNKNSKIIKTLLWKDEIYNLSKIINLPCFYKIQSSINTKSNFLELKVLNLSSKFKRLQKTLDEEAFLEYLIVALQGY